VAQEALTNALRHAPGSPVRVRWGSDGRRVEVVVEDDGRTGLVPPQSGSGHGLIGLRERVALHGGDVAAGPRDDGPGWRVAATVPLRASVTA